MRILRGNNEDDRQKSVTQLGWPIIRTVMEINLPFIARYSCPQTVDIDFYKASMNTGVYKR